MCLSFARRVLACLLVAAPAQAQTCLPTPVQGHSGWSQQSDYVTGATVPAGEVWLITDAGVASNDSQLVDVRLQREEPVLSQQGACCWYIPIAVTASTGATPKAALLRPVYVQAGQRLAARTPVPLGDMALLYSGFAFPAACLQRLLGMDAPVSATATTPPPDFSAAITALQQLSTAAASAASALP